MLTTHQSEERRPPVPAALWALSIGLIGIYLLLFVLGAAARLARPAEEFTYGESWLLDGARQVARGQGLYAPADHASGGGSWCRCSPSAPGRSSWY